MTPEQRDNLIYKITKYLAFEYDRDYATFDNHEDVARSLIDKVEEELKK